MLPTDNRWKAEPRFACRAKMNQTSQHNSARLGPNLQEYSDMEVVIASAAEVGLRSELVTSRASRIMPARLVLTAVEICKPHRQQQIWRTHRPDRVYSHKPASSALARQGCKQDPSELQRCTPLTLAGLDTFTTRFRSLVTLRPPD